MEIRQLDISKYECWIFFQKPFKPEERNEDYVLPYQKKCIDKNIFGLGWRSSEDITIKDKTISIDGVNAFLTDFDGAEIKYIQNNGNLSDRAKNKQIEETNNKSKDVCTRKDGLAEALKSFIKIKKGDYVITRTKDGTIYIGRVSRKPYYFETIDKDAMSDEDIEKYNIRKDAKEILKSSRISWGCEVYKWYPCKTDSVPAEIRGRLSQRNPSTIKRIKNERQRILTRSLFYNYYNEQDGADGEVDWETDFSDVKVIANKSNFVRSLDPNDLEDLIASYIMSKEENKGYFLKPSSCKISEPKYEFRLINNEGGIITCQVKNQENVDVNYYTTEEDEQYDKIYLFSGVWNLTGEDQIRNNNIIKITNESLFNHLKDVKDKLFDGYFNVDTSSLDINEVIKKLEGFKEREKGHRWHDKVFSFVQENKEDDTQEKGLTNGNGNGIYFNNGIAFLSDFNALIKYSEDSSQDESQERLYKDILSNLIKC